MNPTQVADIITSLAEESVRQREAGELQSHWGDTILIDALARLGGRLSRDEFVNCAQRWIEEKLGSLDLTQPAWEWGYLPVAAWTVAEITGRPELAKQALEIVDHIVLKAPRSQGVMTTHSGRPQIWVDAMFFSIPALYRASVETDSSRYKEDAQRQLVGYVGTLVDPFTSLFMHCLDEEFQGPGRYVDGHFEPLDKPVAWARGNAWALLALITAIEEGNATESVRAVARELSAATLALQSPGGGWHTVLDEGVTYLETSASAMFALGLPTGLPGRDSWFEIRRERRAGLALVAGLHPDEAPDRRLGRHATRQG